MILDVSDLLPKLEEVLKEYDTEELQALVRAGLIGENLYLWITGNVDGYEQ